MAQQQVDRAHRLVTERWLPAQIALERMQKAQLDQQTSVRGYVLTAQQSLLAPFREAQSALPQEEGSLRRALADDQAALRQLDDVVAAYTDWATAAGAQVVRVDQGRLDEARQVANVANGAPRFDALRGRVEALRTTIQSRVDTATAELARVRRTMLTLLGIAVALGLALSVVLLVGLRRGVTRPLGQLVDAPPP